MRLLKFPILLILVLLLIGGCARTSPLVGTWAGAIEVGQPAQPANMLSMATGMLGAVLNGPCTLQLGGDGKGFLKVSALPERPIFWSEQNGKVVLRADEAAPAKPAANAAASSAQSNAVVGTLTPDGQTLTLDFGLAKAQLKKQNAP